LARMGEQLRRRGPDDVTSHEDGRFGVVFRRLAINDHAHGRQPITDETGSTVSVVNGEIYNHVELRSRLVGRHRLASRSDCEVVVHLWEEHGPALLNLVNGMFGICVWDSALERGMLARDRLGIKPLYYAPLGDGVLFASELTALLAHPDCPREPDPGAVDLSYVGTEDYTTPQDRVVPTFVRGVHHLGPGEWLPLDAAGCRPARTYWSLQPALDAAVDARPLPAHDYVTGYADLFADAVRLQASADAEVGAFLSGGLDSSVIVAAAAGVRPPGPGCFSVSEPTTVAVGDLARAGDLADRLGLDFHPARFAGVAGDGGDAAGLLRFGLAELEEIVWVMDAPRFAPELFLKHELHRYARTVRPGLKVVLLGQGADEFAGGYSRSYSSPRPTWEAYEREALAPPDGSWTPFQSEMRRRRVVLASHNLWNEDRVAASHGIEARVPFLDHRLVEFLAAIPAERHAELFFDKRIVRRAAARWLPPRWRQAPKVLFWQAGDRSSVHALMVSLVRRAYPEFRDAYSQEFGARRCRELDALAAAVGPGLPGRVAAQQLSAAMTWSIFTRLCADLGRGRVAPGWRPSPLLPDDAWRLDGGLAPAPGGAVR
jgi:asparagine synthase (glutamine-hydrolysing)